MTTSAQRPWRSGWCGGTNPTQCERCVGYGPSPSGKDGLVKCSHDCHTTKRSLHMKAQWQGLR